MRKFVSALGAFSFVNLAIGVPGYIISNYPPTYITFPLAVSTFLLFGALCVVCLNNLLES